MPAPSGAEPSPRHDGASSRRRSRGRQRVKWSRTNGADVSNIDKRRDPQPEIVGAEQRSHGSARRSPSRARRQREPSRGAEASARRSGAEARPSGAEERSGGQPAPARRHERRSTAAARGGQREEARRVNQEAARGGAAPARGPSRATVRTDEDTVRPIDGENILVTTVDVSNGYLYLRY